VKARLKSLKVGFHKVGRERWTYSRKIGITATTLWGVVYEVGAIDDAVVLGVVF